MQKPQGGSESFLGLERGEKKSGQGPDVTASKPAIPVGQEKDPGFPCK